MSKKEYVVEHKRLFLSVDKNLQHVPKGSLLKLDEAAAKKLGGRVKAVDDEVTELSSNESDGPTLEDLRARAAELNIEGSSRWGEKRLTEEIATAEAAIAAGNQV